MSFDRHDRRSVFNVDTHDENQQAHNVVGGTGQVVFRLVGDNNIFGPSTAGVDDTVGGDNIVAGDGAGVSLATTGVAVSQRNILLGTRVGEDLAGVNIGEGSNNAAGGFTCFRDMIDGAGNSVWGPSAMQFIEHGDDNGAFGRQALRGKSGAASWDCSFNNAFGLQNLFQITIGEDNNSQGRNGLDNIGSGDGNNSMGAESGTNFDEDSNRNSAFGDASGPVTPATYNDTLHMDSHATDTPTIHADYAAHDVTINGDFDVTGALSKGSGTFRIEHPIDDTKELLHGFVESPEYGLIYRGKAKLNQGRAVINIDRESGMKAGTFAALARNHTVYLQNMTGFANVRPLEIINATFEIESQTPDSADEISWMVCAERKDDLIMQSDTTDENGSLILERIKRGNRYAGDKAERGRTSRPTSSLSEHHESIRADQALRKAERKRNKRFQLDMEGNLFGKGDKKRTKPIDRS